jgi:hypothetical protein
MAQNEMKAMCGMPVWVRSSEGLGVMPARRGIEALDKRGSVVCGTWRLDEYEVSLLSGYWAMLNASRNDEQFPRAEANTAIAHFDS